MVGKDFGDSATRVRHEQTYHMYLIDDVNIIAEYWDASRVHETLNTNVLKAVFGQLSNHRFLPKGRNLIFMEIRSADAIRC